MLDALPLGNRGWRDTAAVLQQIEHRDRTTRAGWVWIRKLWHGLAFGSVLQR